MVKFFKDKKGRTHPITESKGKSSYSEQTEDTSWKKSSVEDIKNRENNKVVFYRANNREAAENIKSNLEKEHYRDVRISATKGMKTKYGTQAYIVSAMEPVK